jgi:hypothetical protein
MATIVSNRTSKKSKPSATAALKPSTPAKPTPVEASSIDSPAELLRALHWTRLDGSACFATDDTATKKAAWKQLHAAVKEFGDAEIRSVAKRAERRDAKPAVAGKKPAKPAPSYHSEELRTTVLRTDWSSSATQVAIDWSQPSLRCEVICGADVLVSGVVAPQVTIDGRRLTPVGSWEEVCWDFDGEADYLELEISLGGGFRLQRQFLLARTDGLLYIADAVLSESRNNMDCELTLPLVEQAKFAVANETREGVLTTRRKARLVIPAALPEWRSDRRHGELTESADGLTLRQSASKAIALYVPLCLVVDPKRSSREVTWRQLTIGENLQIQPAERAVGYRLQVGREQWLIYRSLTARANRTLLGVNLQTDFLFTRFKSDGTTDNLMEIEE